MPLAYQELLKANPPFPLYNNRAEYKKQTGKDAPDYDPSRKLKFWEDPNAGEDGLPEIIYPNNVMTRPDGTFVLKNGVPVVRPLVLSVEEARTVNLPPEDPSGNTALQSSAEILVPFRDLRPDEVLVVGGTEMRFLSGQQIVIRNQRLYNEAMVKEAEDSGKFTSADRATLKAIAAKLGI